ncbi:putative calcium-binding protein [Zea mays]|uniref:Putative calcium-binding protein n=1 Tax=Zea mays TaxID=4577 RepID=A0A3L6ELW0_MAIZE|nr:putative calcium-binding protein [Zea mays]
MTKKQRREAGAMRRRDRHHHHRRQPRDERCVSCTTFNILAPIYKRMDNENCRESQYRAYWFSRNEKIIDRLLADHSSIICLQEVWLGNDELVDMYQKRLGDANYMLFKLARTNNRGDGLLTAVHRNYFNVLNYRELLFNDIGDRVAQLLHVESAMPFLQNRSTSCVHQQSLIVNTHLLFPHDHSLSIVRLRQVYKILQYIEAYLEEHKLGPLPIILCGSVSSVHRIGMEVNVAKFTSSFARKGLFHHMTLLINTVTVKKMHISHRNHRGNICGVDFIWLLNPDKCRKPLKTSWNEAVFGIIKYFLQVVAFLSEENAFALLKADSLYDHITYSSFYQALCQLGMVHPDRLKSEEIEELWSEADRDGDGVINYKEFQCIWSPNCCSQEEEDTEIDITDESLDTFEANNEAFGFTVKEAVLFPPEVEKGMWPENYSLSDHAPLTVVFSPIRMPCSPRNRGEL